VEGVGVFVDTEKPFTVSWIRKYFYYEGIEELRVCIPRIEREREREMIDMSV